MPLDIVVTNAGRAALINADNTGTAPVAITHVGLSSTAVAALPTLTVLAGEFKRVGAVSGEVVADDTIHLSVMDYSSDSYTLRSVALYLANGTLFAIYGQPGPILEKTASSDAALSLDVILADISAALLSFGDASFVNPPATTARQGVVELATPAEAQAGIDALRALTPAGAKAAILGWLLAQDGAGSGLDADLLDGQQGSYYTNIPARLGFSPLNALVYTAADVLGKLVTVDGAGSGLDADLLDGQQGSYYTAIVARLGYSPVQQGTGIGQNANPVKIGWKASARLGLTVDSVDLGNFVLDGHITDVWRSSNDGAGSGLDADLLDGKQGSAYALLDGTAAFTGSIKAGNPNALLMHPGGNVPTVIHRQDGANYYIMISAPSASHNATWNTLRPFQIDLPTGRFVSANGQIFQGGTSIEGSLQVNGSTVWHAGNDGAGSGLDADLLDGHSGEFYARAVAMSIGQDGYISFNNGLKIVWGRINVSMDAYFSVTYPIAFEMLPAVTFATIDAVANNSQQNSILVDQSPTGFRMYQAGDRSALLPYIAIGR